MDLKENAEYLMSQGYYRVSRKGKVLSRIDRKNWKEYMAKEYAPWDIKEGEKWVASLGQGAGDHYRRVYSNDKIVVSEEICNAVETSCHNCNIFLQKEKLV